MLFRSSDLLADFERMTRGLSLGSELEEMVDDLSKNLAKSAGYGHGVDVITTPDAFELHIDLPGVDPASVEVTVDARVVTVDATRRFEIGEGAELVHAGRRHGSMQRRFELAADLDADQLEARSEHGVLVLSVPRSAVAQPRRVEVTTAE